MFSELVANFQVDAPTEEEAPAKEEKPAPAVEPVAAPVVEAAPTPKVEPVVTTTSSDSRIKLLPLRLWPKTRELTYSGCRKR
ncbi:MAG: hypothetical protein R3B93_20680 [Bacteroidia bacterium]